MAHYLVTDTVKSGDLKPGDTIDVVIEGKTYETVIDDQNVHRFKANTVLQYMFDHDTTGAPVDMSNPRQMHTQMLNLNTLAVAFHKGKFSKRDYMEIVMQGYSVSGFCSLSTFQDWSIHNPLWGNAPERIGGEIEEEDDEDA